jgi:HD superfamily phosphohydrolase
VHSNAFRRLVYKTQVFVNHEGDLYRTRVTHSLEVAQIGRSVAARARPERGSLTEAICLAHDLGHTPFGHAGQDALNECMREYGGFEHNLQSLRVVDELEERYAVLRPEPHVRDPRRHPQALLGCRRPRSATWASASSCASSLASKPSSPISPTRSPTTTTTSMTACAPV